MLTRDQLPAMPPSSPPPPPADDSAMHLDLSELPPLVAPDPPSNTLLITNLTSDALFAPASLQAIRTYLEAQAQTELHSFAPLRSLRRIVVSFPATEHAVAVRRELDRAPIAGCVPRVYFGAPTPVNPRKDLLEAPRADKQFFISPPPSPPHGWTMRDEGPPNRDVHARDLACALEALDPALEPDGDTAMGEAGAPDHESAQAALRRRGSSTVVYEPSAHGAYAGLPAVTVEDTTEDGPRLEGDARILEHTSRPPVELMQ